jgi:hypothetical protein
MVCEDAPCCGCCGHAAWAAEDRFDPYDIDPYDYPGSDEY